MRDARLTLVGLVLVLGVGSSVGCSAPGDVSTTMTMSRALSISPDVVVSQVYGGGGNASAPFTNDYVELFNRGAATVSLAGWSVQYASATGTGNFGGNAIAALSGSIAPGQHFLISLGGGATGAPLPASDASGTVNLSATAGKVALVNVATGLACNGGSAPCTPAQEATIVDLVGYGTANYFEGPGAAPAGSNTAAVLRKGAGCVESNDNAADLEAGAPTPRNRAAAPTGCSGDAAPVVTTTSPAAGAAGVAVTAVVTVTFSEPVAVTGSWYSIACAPSGAVAATASGGPVGYTLTPATNFLPGEACTVTVAAAGVADLGGTPLATDHVLSFTIAPALSAIHSIQGAAHLSAFAGAAVSTRGIVTARSSNGFYLQDPLPDTSDATSEAIFVFTSSAPTVQVGDDILVSGTVSEFRAGCASGCPASNSAFSNLTTTEIVGPSIEITSSGNPLPAPIVLGTGGRLPPTQVIANDASTGNVETSGAFDPAEDGIDFYESLEGMRVQLNDAVVVGPTRSFSGGSLELVVVGDGGAHATPRTSRGGVVVTPGDFNPERTFLGNALGSAIPAANVGDTLPGSIVGVMDYSFGNFKLFPTAALPALVSSGLQRETVSFGPARAAGLDVATFNVENLDPTDPQSKFDELGGIVVGNLGAPDILSLEEVQDDDGATGTDTGTVTAGLTISRLVAAIAAAGGPSYDYRSVDPVSNQDGGEPGGNIRVGFLFRTDRGLAFVDRPGAGSLTANVVVGGPGSPALAFSPGRIDPTNPAFASSRKPLAGEFTFHGRTLFVIANHFNSKGGDQPLFGRFAPPTLGSESQRVAQAQVVAAFVGQLFASDPAADLVVLGDLNDFQFSPPLAVLQGIGLTTLVDTLPQNERYSYVFEGNGQVLDHVMVSPHLLSRLVGFDIVHVNAEFAVQASDHDPGLARFSFDAQAPVITGGGDIVAEGTDPGGALVPFSVSAHDDVDGTVAVVCSPASGSRFPLGTTPVHCSAEDSAGNRGEATFSVTVVDTTPPVLAGLPSVVRTFANSKRGASVTYVKPTATDLVDGARPVTCAPASGTQFAPGETRVTCTAVDAAGNPASASFTVVVTFSAPAGGAFYLSPLRADGGATFRVGSIIPVRFRLTGPSAGISDLRARLFVYRLENGQRIPVLTQLNTYLYEPLTGQYLYPLITLLGRPGRYELVTDLGDGVPHTVEATLTRR